jgi:Trehalose-6-phosphatase
MPLPHLWKETFSDVQRWAGNLRMHSLLLDFDGTLTPVMPDPDSVFLDATVRRVLQEIQDTGRIAIGIISERSLDEIRGRVGICGIIYAGNHGMEIRGRQSVTSIAQPWLPGTRFSCWRCGSNMN